MPRGRRRPRPPSGPWSPPSAPSSAPPGAAAGAVIVAGVALLYLVRELTGIRIPVPQLRRQVPDWWRTYFGRPLAAFLYGAGLGVGFFTFLGHGTLVVVTVGVAATGRPLLGAVADGPLRARERARAVRCSAIEGARGRQPPRRSPELDVGAPSECPERGGSDERGGCRRRHRVTRRRRVGRGGGRDPRGRVRVGGRRQDSRVAPVAPCALGARSATAAGEHSHVGGPGGGGAGTDTHAPGSRAGSGRRGAGYGGGLLDRPPPAGRCATVSASRAAASDVPRSTCGWRSLGIWRSRPPRSLSFALAPHDPALRLPQASDTLPALLLAGALATATITAWRTAVWLGRGRA